MKSGVFEAGSEFEVASDVTRWTMSRVVRDTAATDSPDHEQALRVARMRDAVRKLECEFRVLAAREPHGPEAHTLRVGRAHALAMLDLLDDLETDGGRITTRHCPE